MNASRVFSARLPGCGVFDPAGDRVGKVIDVLISYRKSGPPKVTGLLVEIRDHSQVFVPMAQVTSISDGQVIITSLVDFSEFTQRGQELRVITQMLGREVRLLDGSGLANIEDLAIEQEDHNAWRVGELFLRRPKTSLFSRGATLFSAWEEISTDDDVAEDNSMRDLITSYSELRPADLASALLDLPDERMFEVAKELKDEALADVLEELPEEEQNSIVEELGEERATKVLTLMEPDDAADLVAHLPKDQGEAILELMHEEKAADIRMLMQFDELTAGGLMTTSPIICSADTTVAEAMAMIRKKDVSPVLAASVFVTALPYDTPTGRYLGTVHFQKMLRYPPHQPLSSLLDAELEPITADTHISVIHRRLASYNLVSLPVVDEESRLIGVVTVDDVLDHLLPVDWRTGEEAR